MTDDRGYRAPNAGYGASKLRIIHRRRSTARAQPRPVPDRRQPTGDMIARMTTPASKAAAGSVGTVETQFLDLPAPLRARLRPGAAADPHRLRDLRHAVAGARQRHPGLPRAQRRRARGRLHGDAGRGEHQGRLPRRRARRRQRPRPRLVGRHDRARQGLRHRPLLRRQLEPARRLPRHDRTVVHRTRRRAGPTGRTFRSSPSRTWCGPSARSSTSSASRGWPRSPAARSAACRRSNGRCSIGDQVDAIIPIASTHALQPQGVAWNAIARNAITADPDWQGGHYYGTGRAPTAGHGRRPHGRPHHVSVGAVARRQVRPAAAVRRRHPLHAHRARVRGRELPAPPGGRVRQALRRQHLSLHVAGAVVLRPRPAVRRRPTRATRSATCRRGRCSSRSAPTGCIRRRAPRSWRRRCASAARTSSST